MALNEIEHQQFVVERPNWVTDQARGGYIGEACKIIQTLKIIESTKALKMSQAELVKSLGKTWKQNLKKVAKEKNLKLKIAKDNGSFWIWAVK